MLAPGRIEQLYLDTRECRTNTRGCRAMIKQSTLVRKDFPRCYGVNVSVSVLREYMALVGLA